MALSWYKLVGRQGNIQRASVNVETMCCDISKEWKHCVVASELLQFYMSFFHKNKLPPWREGCTLLAFQAPPFIPYHHIALYSHNHGIPVDFRKGWNQFELVVTQQYTPYRLNLQVCKWLS
jgi:hypothetical protein